MPQDHQGAGGGVGEQHSSRQRLAPAARKAQIAENLAAVNQDIAAAARKAGRDPSEVTLIAVTKTHPASDVRILAELGVLDVGENRDQAAAPKARATAGLGLRWHFIGQLQTNKALSVAEYASFVHSVDRVRLVGALSRGAVRYDKELTCLVQVDLGNAEPMDDNAARGGALPDQVLELAETIAAAPGLRLGGLMAVAPLGTEPGPAFERLHALAMRLRSAHPSATMISAGMSGDLGEAVAAGATHVRIGSAILGIRR